MIWRRLLINGSRCVIDILWSNQSFYSRCLCSSRHQLVGSFGEVVKGVSSDQRLNYTSFFVCVFMFEILYYYQTTHYHNYT